MLGANPSLALRSLSTVIPEAGYAERTAERWVRPKSESRVLKSSGASQSLAESLDCPATPPGRGHATTGISRSFRLCGRCMPVRSQGPGIQGANPHRNVATWLLVERL